MWVKNTKTGNVWSVDKEQGEKLLKEDYFEKTTAPKSKSKTATSDVNEDSE